MRSERLATAALKIKIQYNPNHNARWLFVESGKLVLNSLWKCKEPGIAKTVLIKNSEDLTISDF